MGGLLLYPQILAPQSHTDNDGVGNYRSGSGRTAASASYFTTLVQHAKRERVLDQIEQTGASIEPLASDQSSIRFALTYELRFPKTGHYLTFPAYLGSEGNRIFGNYFSKLHPEYYDENYVFDPGKPYSFTVVFDSEGKRFDSSKEKANIDICDGKEYFMACRVIGVGLEGVPADLTSHPSPGRREPAVPADNVRDLTEKSIGLDGLKLKSDRTKAGEPVEFSDVITNVGEKEEAIHGNDFANVIAINYGWEAISESAKMTKVTPGIVRFGNVVAAGGAQFAFLHQSTLAPAEKLVFQDKIAPFEPLAPGQYRLHVYLFSRYATELNKPEQELFQELPSFCNPVVLSGNGQDRAASRCRSDRPLLRSSAMSHMLEKDISRDPPSTPACSDHQSVLLSTRGFTNGGAF